MDSSSVRFILCAAGNDMTCSHPATVGIISNRAKHRALGVVLLGLVCAASLGCQGAIVTAYYLFKGTNADADYPGLKDKKVVVVCKPVVSIHYRNQNVSRELSQKVSALLQNNLKKHIKIVDQRKVNKWCDENTWEEYTEIGKALKADMVVAIDLEGFSIFEGQTLYKGNANSTVHVFDCKAGGKEVFSKKMPPTIYPPNASIPMSEKQEDQFRSEFVDILAVRVARHFYEHDAFDDVAVDAQSLR